MGYILLLILIVCLSVAFWIYDSGPSTPSPLEAELNKYQHTSLYSTDTLVAHLLYHDFEQALSEGFITHITHFQLKRQLTLPQDPYAVAVYTGRFKIGYLPIRYSEKIARELDQGHHFTIILVGYYPYKTIFERLEVRLINHTLKSQLSQPVN
jgi:hypothetical protein